MPPTRQTPACRSAHELFRQACDLHQAGQLEEAGGLYGQVLAAQPGHAGALCHLGLIAQARGQGQQALELLGQALARDPNLASAHYNLGMLLRGAARQEAALPHLERAASLEPAWPEAWLNLARTRLDLGRGAEAREALERVLGLRPDWPLAWRLMAAACLRLGDHQRSEEACRRLLAQEPRDAAGWNLLGMALGGQGCWDQARQALQTAVQHDPSLLEAWHNLAGVCLRLGRPEVAQACARQALELAPHSAGAWLELGRALEAGGQGGQAMGAYQRAGELDPGLAGAPLGLGRLHFSQGRSAQAIACLERATDLDPGLGEAWAVLSGVYWAQGRLEQALAASRRALELSPRDAALHSNLLMLMQYAPQCGGQERLQAARDWDRQHGPSTPTPRPRLRGADPDKRLRLGYVSGDLRAHPVGYFLQAFLPHHDPAQVEVVLLADQDWEDAVSADLRAHASAWVSLRGLDDSQALAKTRGLGIDILLDLAGHTAGNRLGLFARRAAPLQISWLGYAASTGLEAMDYVIGDQVIIPPEEEGQYCERVARLPHCYICLGPPPGSPPVGPPPARQGGGLTLGSFNTMAKVTPQVVQLWAEILRALPGARLFLKNKQLGDAEVAQRYRGLFAAQGVEPARLRLEGGGSRLDFLRAYQEVDIALDPFPYGGGVTTFEALWMGVPVITMPGDRFVSHHAQTILHCLELKELVCAGPGRYLELALALAGDPPRLAGLRAGLRGRMLASPLMDGAGFARGLEALLRGLWRDWLAKG